MLTVDFFFNPAQESGMYFPEVRPSLFNTSSIRELAMYEKEQVMQGIDVCKVEFQFFIQYKIRLLPSHSWPGYTNSINSTESTKPRNRTNLSTVIE